MCLAGQLWHQQASDTTTMISNTSRFSLSTLGSFCHHHRNPVFVWSPVQSESNREILLLICQCTPCKSAKSDSQIPPTLHAHTFCIDTVRFVIGILCIGKVRFVASLSSPGLPLSSTPWPHFIDFPFGQNLAETFHSSSYTIHSKPPSSTPPTHLTR